MEKVIALVMKSPARRQRYDDDAVDRLHHRYTVLVIVVFAVVVGMQHYIGRPVTCWTPAHFKGGWTKFTNNYCWIKNTYHLPTEDYIPKEHEDGKRREILYYQWMPFILLFQAFLFYVPCQIWRAFNSKSGVDSDNILASAEKFSHAIKGESREKSLMLITNQIDRFIASPRSKGSYKFSLSRILSNFSFGFGAKFGNYLVMLYLTVKLLYIGNVFLQLFVLNSVLKTNFNVFGFEQIKNMENKRGFMNNTVFPKVTMCDFKIRVLGNVQRHTVQCVLPFNLYSEIMYVFLWWWMVLVLAATVANLLVWVARTIFSSDRLKYIRTHLEMEDLLPNNTEHILSKDFTYHYLKQDGVFLLRMIGHNTNQITVNEVLASLWQNWRERQKNADRNNLTPDTRYPVLPNDSTLPLKKQPPPSPPSPPRSGNKPKVPPKPNAIFRPNPSAPPEYSQSDDPLLSLDQPDGSDMGDEKY